MSFRYFFHSDPDSPPQPTDKIVLDQQESHHLIHVMRADIGDSITLFDGSGNEYESEIREKDRRSVTVELLSQSFVDRELAYPLIVAVPIPKSDRQKFLVEKLTELGVSQLIFVETARSSVKGNQKTIEKLNRLVIEASKQCRRNILMKLDGPISFSDLISLGQSHEGDRFFAHPDVDPVKVTPDQSNSPRMVLIGPEGGLDEQEVNTLQTNHWSPLSLGKTILRMETAALVAATILSNR